MHAAGWTGTTAQSKAAVPAVDPAFDQIACIRLEASGQAWAGLQNRLKQICLTDRVMDVSPDPALVERRVVVALSHRVALRKAFEFGSRFMLVLEDHCLLLADTADRLRPVLIEWGRTEAGLLYLGNAAYGGQLASVGKYPHLRRGHAEGCFAVGYSRPAMERLLSEMPARAPQMSDWIAQWGSFDRYLASQPDRVLAHPRLATSIHLLPYEDPALRGQYLP